MAWVGPSWDCGEGGVGTDRAASDCLLPASAWLDTLETAFYPEFQDTPGGIMSSAYVEVDTSEGRLTTWPS